MKYLLVLFCFLFSYSNAQTIDEAKLVKHISVIEKQNDASSYISKEFKKIGLKPFEGTKKFVLEVEGRKTKNVLGFIDNNKDHTIIIGAKNMDINASGLAALLELARFYSENKKEEAYNLLFVAFGSETGANVVSSIKGVDSEKINGFINLDEIGNYDTEVGLTIGGVGTSSVLEKWGPELGFCMEFETKIDSTQGTKGGQIAFYEKQIPVLFLNTPKTENVNNKGVKLISNYVIQLISHLEDLPKMDFIKL